MKKKMKRLAAWMLVLSLCTSLLNMAALAMEEPPLPEIVDGGETVFVETSAQGGETVDVIVSAEEQPDGTVETIAKTVEGGQVLDSGLTVTFESVAVEEPAADPAQNELIRQESAYTAADPAGTYLAQGGSETTVEILTPAAEDAVSAGVELYDENGQLKQPAEDAPLTAGGSSGTAGVETVPTAEGSQTRDENPAVYDQTTVTVTDRQVELSVNEVQVESGDPEFVDENGEPIVTDKTGYVWSNATAPKNNQMPAGFETRFQTVTWYAVQYDEDGQPIAETQRKVNSAGVRQWTLDNQESGEKQIGLYCVDASISAMPFGQYRIVNLEDAVEEGYYTEEDAAHLRAIGAYGYEWYFVDGEALKEDPSLKEDPNLKKMNEQLRQAGVLAEGESLTREQAAVATNMAIWKYGNRFDLQGNEQLKPAVTNDDGTIMKVYEYLAAQTMEAPDAERDIINEEKFVDDLELVVGGMAQGAQANEDEDDTNDVYDVELKFSLVVEPDQNSDDLIVKVLDSTGKEVKAARIAGVQKEGEQFGYAKTETDQQGKTYYVLEGMQLTENANTEFNLKLEGTQLLQEGVYVFEAKHMTAEEAVDAFGDYCGYDDAWKESVKQDEAALAEIEGYYARSQNFIGKYEGTAEVDVGMTVDLVFNVEESTVTTTREWRTENWFTPEEDQDDLIDTGDDEDEDEDDGEEPEDEDAANEGDTPDDPAASSDPDQDGVPPVTDPDAPPAEPTGEDDTSPAAPADQQDIPEEDVPLAEGEVSLNDEEVPLAAGEEPEEAEEILDELIPLSDIPATGDRWALWTGLMLVSLCGLLALALTGKKREEI